MSDELIHKSEMQKWIESKARKPKMSDDLISRQAAIDIVFRSPFFSDSLMEELRALPSVQPKTGQWVYGEFDIPYCSKCGTEVMPCDVSKYCPNCGAKMESEGNENG